MNIISIRYMYIDTPMIRTVSYLVLCVCMLACLCTHLYQTECVYYIPQIHANCRIRRVYFSDRLYSEDELPAEFKLYLPVQNKSPGKVSHRLMFYFTCI